MAHALAQFIADRMQERGLRNRDVVAASGLSRALVSKYVSDKRDTLTRLPERSTLEGLAKALGVSPEFLLSKAVEALGLGYEAGDFINAVSTAPDEQLLAELAERLARVTAAEPVTVSAPRLSVVPPSVDDVVAADQDEDPDLAAREAEEPVDP